jgi:hypothetical protein
MSLNKTRPQSPEEKLSVCLWSTSFCATGLAANLFTNSNEHSMFIRFPWVTHNIFHFNWIWQQILGNPPKGDYYVLGDDLTPSTKTVQFLLGIPWKSGQKNDLSLTTIFIYFHLYFLSFHHPWKLGELGDIYLLFSILANILFLMNLPWEFGELGKIYIVLFYILEIVCRGWSHSI